MQDMPQMFASSYSSNTFSGEAAQPMAEHRVAARGMNLKNPDWMAQVPELQQKLEELKAHQYQPNPGKESRMTARIVKVFMADSDENLPLDKRVLYAGEEKLTDLIDQELYFEIPVQTLLKEHNAVREATLDKKATAKSGKDVFLEPLRIRDLKMVVVTIASF